MLLNRFVEKMKTAPITVEYINHLGSDLDVVNAARVSFDKESEWESEALCPTDPVTGGKLLPYNRLKEQDAKLIDYLAKHKHWSPFSHCYVKFRIKAPIFVARQLQKHTVGLAWNEVSRRYVDSEPEFYFPDFWRSKADNIKQGSSLEHNDAYEDNMGFGPEFYVAMLRDEYMRLISCDVCPEQARMILPQNTITEWIWSGSLAAFARVVKLRTDPHSQYETSLVAHGIKYNLDNLFPVSTKALLAYD